MTQSSVRSRVNECTPDPSVVFDRRVAELHVRYARMVVARGYIHNTLGNIAIRVRHPNYADGVLYTKPSGLSLEEVMPEDLVVTDVIDGRLLHGSVPTSVGHQLNREIMRLRPDVNAVIHVHDDATIALLASGVMDDLRGVSLEFPYVMCKPPHIVPSHLDVEEDVSPIREFIQETNSLVMKRHGISTLGRTVSEAYHRLNTITSEIRRMIMVAQLSKTFGTTPDYLSQAEMDWMYERGEKVIYPNFEKDRQG
jgi:ribulose-5-phosphate 4-epimerase/fuculose-1-phosphate aldolase